MTIQKEVVRMQGPILIFQVTSLVHSGPRPCGPVDQIYKFFNLDKIVWNMEEQELLFSCKRPVKTYYYFKKKSSSSCFLGSFPHPTGKTSNTLITVIRNFYFLKNKNLLGLGETSLAPLYI